MDTQQRVEVGKQITEARKARGWSRKRLAREAGVGSENTIARMETGERTQEGKLRDVCDTLGLLEPVGDTLVLQGLSVDARTFLRLAATVLSTAGPEKETRMLLALYPIISEFSQNGAG